MPWLRPCRGKDHVPSFFTTLAALEFKRFEPKLIVGDGDTVLALIDVEAAVSATGGSIDDLEVHVWTFHPDGRVRSLRHVIDTANTSAPSRDERQQTPIQPFDRTPFSPLTRKEPGRTLPRWLDG